ncbi:hypothetical protein BGX24_004630, partial [Mortierella sp. AD032]
MEDNNSESLQPPLSTSKTTTANAQSSIDDHAAANTPSVRNSSEKYHSQTQQQPDQLATAPFSKLSSSSLYDWQLLPQEELDRIAYNSHRQRKARLREAPPTCAQCPEAKFTSMAMLSAHYLSKRHLARVRRQEQRQGQDQDIEKQKIPPKRTPPTLDTPAIIADNNPSRDITMEDVSSRIKPDNQEQSSKAGRTAIQRKRKQERDHKKARARLAKQLDSISKQSTPSVAKQHIEEEEEEKEANGEVKMAASDKALDNGHHRDRKDPGMSTALSD